MLTCSIPRLCSSDAAEISALMSATRRIACCTSPIVRPTASACAEPSRTVSTERWISSLISFAALDARCARLRTSPATTAKPRPCSPARAASTAAFSARMLVWNAMLSISPVMSAIFDELVLISVIVTSIRCTTSLPLSATSDALAASVVAWRALSEFCLTVAVSSSMLAAVSSSDAACSSVRDDRSMLPAAISLDATEIDSLDALIPRTISARCVSIWRSATSRRPNSSFVRISIAFSRWPSAMRCAAFIAMPSGCVIARCRYCHAPIAAATPIVTIPSNTHSSVWNVSLPWSAASLTCFALIAMSSSMLSVSAVPSGRILSIAAAVASALPASAAPSAVDASARKSPSWPAMRSASLRSSSAVTFAG
ncbi:hypothetical protein BUB20358_05547 [Burkholderia ubonensis]|nr:hypothetical protein BUB20358_05547 [Burkholderia ubonensis]